MKKIKFKIENFKSLMLKVFHIVCGLVVFAFIFALFAFVEEQKGNLLCNTVNVSIFPGDEFFIESANVQGIINNEKGELNERLIRTVDLRELESDLERNPFINNAEVYTDLGGNLMIDVTQVQALVRIINKRNESFYLDKQGNTFPTSKMFSSRVMVANGNIGFGENDSIDIIDDNKNNEHMDLYKLAKFISASNFWNAQIEQIYVNDKKEYELIPRVGGHKILFGNTDKIEEKFEKLYAFYMEGLSKVGWEKYKTINLKYQDQIVCSRYF
ncbi:MAG: cell division protein FtsQ [Bacteroidia bacterium]|nr:cell division protein FtsQ [Bacteroidia bacterium]